MPNLITDEKMDAVLDALEKRPARAMSAAAAIAAYYPKLKAVAEKKALRIRDIWATFTETTGIPVSQNSFETYWHAAARAHKAGKPAQTAKPVQPSGNPVKAAEPVKQIAEPSPLAASPAEPVKQKHTHTASTASAQAPRPAPGFQTEDDIRAKDEALRKKYGI